MDPIFFIAVLIVVSVIASIAAAIFGVDKGVMRNMAESEYARPDHLHVRSGDNRHGGGTRALGIAREGRDK
jgi:hypothetical protein